MSEAGPFEPTEEQRRRVRAMAGFGVPPADIAVVLDIDARTLHRHFGREIEVAPIEANAKIAGTLFQQAMAGSTSAAIFWMKSRAGWREKHDISLITKSPNEMTDAELMQIIAQGQAALIDVDVNEE